MPVAIIPHADIPPPTLPIPHRMPLNDVAPVGCELYVAVVAMSACCPFYDNRDFLIKPYCRPTCA